MAANERIPYDEFSMFHENAHEFGLPYGGPPAVRREFVDLGDGRRLSGLVWGVTSPELVFLHGGAQNAHTWDTVALALGRPLLALDLPGHGQSDDGRHGSADVTANAEDVATAMRTLAPDARGVVGISLGGMTALALAQDFPSLVRAVVLVDVTPGVNAVKSKVIADFVNGPDSFPDFDQILARTVAHNPGRTVSSLRRGILHNALQREDGTWVWRYRRFNGQRTEHADGDFPQFASLWEAVSSLQAPLMLVRGMQPQSVVDDADETELLRRSPSARVARVEEAGHSVQGDSPLELARLIDHFIA
jgi:pimeloyl-ACP methyl ester carboxylesterase